jgi:diketogulonate reductase-like aldo/keto reductase
LELSLLLAFSRFYQRKMMLPSAGLGSRLKGEAASIAAENAISIGYSLIDTAQVYKMKWKSENASFYTLGTVFITSKYHLHI